MKTFEQFLVEQDDMTKEIESNDVYQFKAKMAELINDFLRWQETETIDADVDAIKNKALKLRNDMSFAHKRMISSEDLESNVEQEEYKNQYGTAKALLDEFEDPPADVQDLLKRTAGALSNLHMFIQSKLKI